MHDIGTSAVTTSGTPSGALRKRESREPSSTRKTIVFRQRVLSILFWLHGTFTQKVSKIAELRLIVEDYLSLPGLFSVPTARDQPPVLLWLRQVA
jgi:hypothetical protein